MVIFDSFSDELTDEEAGDCFYRGGFYNWFEGGPISMFLTTDDPGFTPESGERCRSAGRLKKNLENN